MEDHTKAITRTIESMPWLKQFFTNAPTWLIARMEPVLFEAGKQIIQKGESNPFIYILYEGSLNIINEFENNRVFTFATKEAPGFSGLLELLSEQDSATSTVETSSSCRFIRIRKELFARWMKEDIHAFRLVVRIFAKQLYPSLYNMGSAYVYPKYHTLVEYLIRSHGAEAIANGTALVPETREDLSEILGLSLRTVYRLCTRLVTEKHARIVKKKIVLTASQVECMTAYLENETYEHLA